MIVGEGIVKKFGALIKEAEKQTIEAMKEGRIPTEPKITGHFLGQIETVFKEQGQDDHILFKPWYLRDQGPTSANDATEREFGADFCGVLDVRLKEFTQAKGFLCQAKMNGRGVSIESTFPPTAVSVSQGKGSEELGKQVANMLGVTHESFVIVYSDERFVVIPATSVQGLTGTGPVYGKPVDRFFKEFLMCFVGDPRLKASDHDSLQRLRERTNSRNALMIQVVETDSWKERICER